MAVSLPPVSQGSFGLLPPANNLGGGHHTSGESASMLPADRGKPADTRDSPLFSDGGTAISTPTY